MDGRITGGSASYTKRIQPAQYEPVEATVKLDFSVNEDVVDHAGVLGMVLTAAKSAVLVQLGLQQPAAPAAPLAHQATQGKVRHVKSATIEALDNAPATAGKDASAQAAPAAVADDPLAPAAAGPVSKTAAGSGVSTQMQTGDAQNPSADDPLAPAAVSGAVPGTADTSAPSVPTGPAVADDPLAPAGAAVSTSSGASTDDPFTAQREVTDVDLGTAVARKNEALIKVHGPDGTMKIRDLVGQYCAAGQHIRTIPQAQRASFLGKLEGLS